MQRRVGRGDASQAVAEGQRALAIVATALDVLSEQRGIAAVQRRARALAQAPPLRLAHRLTQHIGKTQRVAQAEVEALRTDRMDGLRGVADQHQPLGHQLLRDDALQRPGAARADLEHAARAPAELPLQPFDEAGIVERHRRVGLIARHAAQGAEAPTGHRQQGAGAGRGQTFVGGVRLRGGQLRRGHQQGLRVVVFVDADAGRHAQR